MGGMETLAAPGPMATVRPRRRKPVGRQVDDAQMPLLLGAVERSLAKGGAGAPTAADPFLNEVLPLFNQTREDYLSLARRIALELHKKLQRPITVDDVRAVCAPPKEWDGRLMGAIFKTEDWVWHGFVRSTRTTCHKRGISSFLPASA